MGMYALSPLPLVALLAVKFSETVTLGSALLGILIALATIVTIMYGVKYKALASQQEKVIETLEAGVGAWKETAERHELEKKVTADLVATQKATIARLESLPNLAIILDKMAEKEMRQDEMAKERLAHAIGLVKEMNEDMWAQHEAHANRRTSELSAVLRDNNKLIRKVLKEVDDSEDT